MKSLPGILIAAAAVLSAPLPAHAADLTVVNVSAPAVNCVFNIQPRARVGAGERARHLKVHGGGDRQRRHLGIHAAQQRRLPAIAHLIPLPIAD